MNPTVKLEHWSKKKIFTFHPFHWGGFKKLSTSLEGVWKKSWLLKFWEGLKNIPRLYALEEVEKVFMDVQIDWKYKVFINGRIGRKFETFLVVQICRKYETFLDAQIGRKYEVFGMCK